MVKYLLTFFILFFQVSSFAQDVSFSAYLDRNSIASGEKFQMKLELVNADPYSAPDTSQIPSDILILSQSQESTMQVVNGVTVKTISWIYDMQSEKSGNFNFPAISIQTNKGQFKTLPFRIVITSTDTLPQAAESGDGGEVKIEASIDNKDPFQDEPVLYRLKILYTTPVEQADISKPKSEKAVIEQVTDPVQTKEKIDDVEYDVVTIDYSITPISSGKIVIEPSVLRGTVLKDVKEDRPRTAFDDFFDPFSILESGGSIVQKQLPFTVASDKVEMNVKPPVSSVSPWLALHDLKLESELMDVTHNPSDFKDISGKVGEPFNMKVTMTGVGKLAEQLPDVEKYIKTDEFKIYVDKPELKNEKISDGKTYSGTLRGIKTQVITLIPQKSGKLTIPSVSIPYWNISGSKEEDADIKAKEIKISEVDSGVMDIAKNITTDSQKKTYFEAKSKLLNLDDNRSLAIILILIIIIVILYGKISGLKRRLDEESSPVVLAEIPSHGQANYPVRKISDKSNNSQSSEKIHNVSVREMIIQATTFEELKSMIQKFASSVAQVSEKASLPVIAQNLSRNYNIDKGRVVRAAAGLESAIEGRKSKDVEYYRKEFITILTEIEELIKSTPDLKNPDVLEKLNP